MGRGGWNTARTDAPRRRSLPAPGPLCLKLCPQPLHRCPRTPQRRQLRPPLTRQRLQRSHWKVRYPCRDSRRHGHASVHDSQPADAPSARPPALPDHPAPPGHLHCRDTSLACLLRRLATSRACDRRSSECKNALALCHGFPRRRQGIDPPSFRAAVRHPLRRNPHAAARKRSISRSGRRCSSPSLCSSGAGRWCSSRPARPDGRACRFPGC